MQRIAITGMGAVTTLGLTLEETWVNLLAGKSGVGPITFYDASGYDVQIAGEIKGFDYKIHLPPNAQKAARSRMHRCTHLAVRATYEALSQSGLEITAEIADQVGVAIGTGGGSLDRVGFLTRTLDDPQRGPRKISPFEAAMLMPNASATRVAQLIGAKGPSLALSAACATGNDSIGYAALNILTGRAKVMIAGGTEALNGPLTNAIFNAAQALTDQFNHAPQKASRPLDLLHSGFVWGEGAAATTLEDEAFARARGANILGYLLGWCSTNDAGHDTAPDGIGSRRAMQGAIRDAGLEPEDIDVINLHGTSTPVGDRFETLAIKATFGEKLGIEIPVVANKSQLGHLIGAASAVESIITLKMLQTGLIPPTINLEDQDPECNLNASTEVRSVLMRYALKNGFGFGGMNSSLVFGSA